MKKPQHQYSLLMAGTLLAITFFLNACSSEPDFKRIRQEVVEHHDKLMADGEIAMHHKLVLDTFMTTGLAEAKKATPGLDTAAERKHIQELIVKLNAADESMMDWMQEFKADMEGISNAEAVNYFNGEKTKLLKMDSLYKVALDGAAAYLKKIGKDTHHNHDGHDHSKH